MPVPDVEPRRSKSRKAKPFVVEWRTGRRGVLWKGFRDWSVFGRYRTKDIAEEVIDLQTRKLPDWEFRLREVVR